MNEIKKTLAYWNDNSENFDAKLVAREETGCCESASGGMQDGTPPCEE